MPWIHRLEYPITRPFTLPYLTFVIYPLVFFVTILATLLNVAAVGYDLITVYSKSYNASNSLWYENIPLIKQLSPPSWQCEPGILKPGDRTSHHSV